MTKLMQITVLMADTKTHAACRWLELNGATSMMVRALPNGDAAPLSKDASAVQRGLNQQQWVAKAVTRQMTGKELRELWKDSGFPKETIYNAISRAVRAKLIRKVKPGVYAPGKAVTRG